MALSTTVYISADLDVEEVWAHCLTLIGADGRYRWDERDLTIRGRAFRSRMGEMEQYMCALLSASYRPGEMVCTPAEAAACDVTCDPGCARTTHSEPCWLSVNFETSYLYRDRLGTSGDLHARLVDALGNWLADRRVPWRWYNEFTGRMFTGFDGLPTLGSTGGRERSWIGESVLPA